MNDSQKISNIVSRWEAMNAIVSANKRSRVNLFMDIEMVHSRYGLDLDGLLNASSPDFAHDVYGIGHHLDRVTGQLTDCFSPRYERRGEE